jgi:S1-C subfamily serine protease
VAPDGPAADAGLRSGDVIVAIGGREIDGVDDLYAELRRRRPGQRVKLAIARGDERREINVTLAEKPAG